MLSVPEMSNRAYGIRAGLASAMATCWGSMPRIFGMPGGTSRWTVGQRRTIAISAMRGSGFTATGCFTAERSGRS